MVFLICNAACHSKPARINTTSFISIDIQPFNDLPAQEANYITDELKKVYPHVTLLVPIDMPATAFYASRNRYRADSLIRYLAKQTPAGHVTIGLTTRDISTTKDKVADWGVMGLGFRPGAACIASSYRLAKNEKSMQLFKVAIHELGHTQGLPHCSVKYCFMRDAEGQNPTNEETAFCNNCKSVLVNKGWRF
jgi:archaemetzincin